jgi:hypothetical protein
MAGNERSVEIAGGNLAGQNHVCAFFNIGGLLRENPFFVPPDQFLNEMRERRSARKTAS